MASLAEPMICHPIFYKAKALLCRQLQEQSRPFGWLRGPFGCLGYRESADATDGVVDSPGALLARLG